MILIVACLFVQLVVVSNCEYQDNTPSDLLLSFSVHRHGDRTPDPDEIILAEDPALIQKLSFPDGASGLTLEGKRRGYQLGKFLRQRYGSKIEGQRLLSDLYLQEQIGIRSTDLPRTKMTILTLLAALYPPVYEQQWGSDLGQFWQPIPYIAVPSPKDYLRFTANCNRYKELLAQFSKVTPSSEFVAYKDLAAELFNITGYNFTERPLLYATLHDLFRSEAAIGLTLPKWAQPLQTRINEAAKTSYDLYMKNDEMKKLATGVIIKDFLDVSSAIIAGESVNQRVRIYTAHDYNVGALMAISQVKLNSIPDYCSLFALELHRCRGSGEYFVKPVYLKKAGESEATVLKVDGCGKNYCDFESFRKITEKYAITEEEYFDICKNVTS